MIKLFSKKFRTNLFLLLAIGFASHSFSQKAENFGVGDPEFEVKTAPAKWAKASAVVLHQKSSASFTKKGSKILKRDALRRRVLIQDADALESYSEFYFPTNISQGIKVIKSNGDEEKVDFSDAIPIDGFVPGQYRTYGGASAYEKIAIPNLQVGDIIDYHYTTENVQSGKEAFSFNRYHFTLATEYPILSQEFSFEVDRGFWINFDSYLGAPKIEYIGNGTDHKGKVRDYIAKYSFKDMERDALKRDRWSNQFLEYASLKFQVTYFPKSKYFDSQIFVEDDKKVKQTVTKEDVIDKVRTLVKPENSWFEPFQTYLEKAKLEDDKDKIFENAYYFYRFRFNRWWWILGSMDENRYASETGFATFILNVAKHYDLDLKVAAFVPPSLGGWNQLMFWNEIYYGFTPENGNMFFAPSSNSIFGYCPAGFEDSDYILFDLDAKGYKYTSGRVPGTSHETNIQFSKLELDFTDDLDGIILKTEEESRGHLKNNYTEWLALGTFYKTETKDYSRYVKEYAISSWALDGLRDSEQELKQSLAAYWIDDGLKVKRVSNLKLKENGRTVKKPSLIVSHEVELEEFSSKAGKNLIAPLGMLIGGQIALTDEEIERELDIHMAFKKSYHNEILLRVPEGVSIEGVENLAVDVENAIGAFVATVEKTAEGNYLIKTRKDYKKSDFSKSQWPDMVEWLEAAYNFTQKKVVLKKL